MGNQAFKAKNQEKAKELYEKALEKITAYYEQAKETSDTEHA